MLTLKEKPTLYNISAGRSFADSLAQGLLLQTAGNPLALSEYTILLPSRRGCRVLREAFLRLSEGKALLLPRMRPLGDVDADEIVLQLEGEEEAEAFADIPPAVSRLERQMLLARTILAADMAPSFDQAAGLARELGDFLDEVQTEGLDFAKLENLVPQEFAGHWQKTLDFLKIITENWPKILEERGVIDYAQRRNLLLEAQLRAWEKNPPPYPIIAAGTTGTVPASARLVALVSCLPQGALVFPGLDKSLDEESWQKMGADHPQANMKKLLQHYAKATRQDVQEWPVQDAQPVNTERVRLLTEALRPAETTDHWRRLKNDTFSGQAVEGLTRIDCVTPQEEADIIGLIMRETLETEGKTCALVTPDRRLARRVSLSLRRWGILLDDSGGQPLTELPVGAWFMLCAEMAEEALAPVGMLACLKHPFMAARHEPAEWHGLVQLLDRLVLRGPRPAAGLEGLKASILALEERDAAPRARLLTWLESVAQQMGDFVEMFRHDEPAVFKDLLAAHIAAAEHLAQTPDKQGADRLWRGEAGEALVELLRSLRSLALLLPPMRPREYTTLLKSMMKAVTVRPRYGLHPRLYVLGQAEARMYSADKVILGGLNEGTWPDIPAHDPWMSRPMRKAFGLPPHEKAISLSSHDFVQAASMRDVVLTRAEKVDGTPTVPARWLMRLEAVLDAAGLTLPNAQTKKYKQWLRALDDPQHPPKTIARPMPKPETVLRPRRLSVTKIETWMRDPYQIYAQYVLGLRALEPLDADPGGAERGTFVHQALERFIKTYPQDIPANAVEELKVFGREALEDLRISEDVTAFWWPRFERTIQVFLEAERAWRATAKPFLTETAGEWTFAEAGGDFTLTGKADRIDKTLSGAVSIIDYKSAQVPSAAEVARGVSPQLPLEALMVERGAFPHIGKGVKVVDILYWDVSGGGNMGLRTAISKVASMADLMAQAEDGLRQLVQAFDNPETPYISQPRSKDKPRYSDYDHLARVKEWGVAEGDD